MSDVRYYLSYPCATCVFLPVQSSVLFGLIKTIYVEVSYVSTSPRSSTRDGRYLLFYFRSDIDIFKPSIVDIDTDTDTCKLKLSFKLLKEYNQ